MMRSGRTKSEEANLQKDIYFSDNYFAFPQMTSFIEQIWLVREIRPATVLEIGKGNGFVSNFLKSMGISVMTYDINPNLEPDIVGSIDDLEKHFPDHTFDLVLCAEVLEHMPFEEFENHIRIISKICNYFIITLPSSKKILMNVQSFIKIPKIKYKLIGFCWRIRSKKIAKDHHWELDSSIKTKYKNVMKIFSMYYEIKKYGRFRFHPYHNYFVLQKK